MPKRTSYVTYVQPKEFSNGAMFRLMETDKSRATMFAKWIARSTGAQVLLSDFVSGQHIFETENFPHHDF
jgi:hypothetical protein